MKHKILFITAILLFSVAAKAQFGIIAGVDETTLRGYSPTKYKTGFHIGLTYDLWKMSKKMYFQTGLLFTLGGFKTTGIEPYNAEINLYALELPLNFSYRIPVKHNNIRLEAGPYLRVGILGNNDTYYYGLAIFEPIKGKTYDLYNRFDAGINIGVGFDISKHYYVASSYQLGFTDAPKDVYGVQNMRFRFSVGYIF